MVIQEYIDNIIQGYKSGTTPEQEYRVYLKKLIQNSAARARLSEIPEKAGCSAPHYVVVKNSLSAGYVRKGRIEAPPESPDEKKELDLCRISLANILLTNYLEFHLYQGGEFKSSVSVAQIREGRILSDPADHSSAETLLKAFLSYKKPSIDTVSLLCTEMARKAKLLACIFEEAISRDEKQSSETFIQQLADIPGAYDDHTKAGDLANIYAQTISFGMFAARLYGGPSVKGFSRGNACEFIPGSYSFLKGLFSFLARNDLDVRIAWLIDDFAEAFNDADMPALADDFRKISKSDHPFRRFHEDFLKVYDPRWKENRAGKDSPQPVVSFMAEAFDHYILSSSD